MKHRFALVTVVAIWLGTFILLIPSPSRGLPFIAALLVMGLPIWMLSWPVVNLLMFFSYPIGILLMLATSWGVIVLSKRKKSVIYVDLAILGVFLIVAIAIWL